MNFQRAVSTILILCLPTLTGSQIACPGSVYVGNPNISIVPIPTQSGHGTGQSIVVYDPAYRVQCSCGVIIGWHLVRYDNFSDSCDYNSCDIDFVVYRDVKTASTLTATVVGSYSANINGISISIPPYIDVTMPNSQWIPVQYGDVLGWNGDVSSVVYYEERCGGTCPSGLPSTNQYLFGPVASTLTPGSTVSFKDGPAYSYPYNRYFGIRAIVNAGTRPSIVGLPKTISLTDSTPVGTVVHSVGATDPETKQSITYRITGSCPQASLFQINSTTGEVSVNQSLVGAQSVQVLTIEVSDQCLTNSADLTINIIDVTDTMPEDEPSFDFFKSGVGYALIASSVLSCIVAVGTSIGLGVFCWQLSRINSQLDHVKGTRFDKPKPGDGKFLYNGTKEYSLDITRTTIEDQPRQSPLIPSRSTAMDLMPTSATEDPDAVNRVSSGHSPPEIQ